MIRSLALVSAVWMMLAHVPASADETASPTVGECLASSQVWLLIVAEDGERLRSECVGRPQTGSQALAAADVEVARAANGIICTLAGHPQTCPRTFDGVYWQYWHADGVDQPWVYSGKGADRYQVPPGSIQGWCRNLHDEERCVLPALLAEDGTAPRVDFAADEGGNWWPALVGVGVLVGAIGVVWLRRRDAQAAADGGPQLR